MASPLLGVKGFDITEGVTIDYMHVVCLGVTKTLLEKWLNHKNSPYFIGDGVSFDH
jgi:hypothetical protein